MYWGLCQPLCIHLRTNFNYEIDRFGGAESIWDWSDFLATCCSLWILHRTSLIDKFKTTWISQGESRSAKWSAKTWRSIHESVEKKLFSRSWRWSGWSRNDEVGCFLSDCGPIRPRGDVSAIMGDFLSLWESALRWFLLIRSNSGVIIRFKQKKVKFVKCCT